MRERGDGTSASGDGLRFPEKDCTARADVDTQRKTRSPRSWWLPAPLIESLTSLEDYEHLEPRSILAAVATAAVMATVWVP